MQKISPQVFKVMQRICQTHAVQLHTICWCGLFRIFAAFSPHFSMRCRRIFLAHVNLSNLPGFLRYQISLRCYSGPRAALKARGAIFSPNISTRSKTHQLCVT